MGRRNGLMTTLAAIAAVVLLAGCGGGDDSGSGGGSDATTTARGPITYVQGKDNTNIVRPLLDKWNTAHPDEKVTFKEQSDEADAQHDDLVQHFQAKDVDYDVVSVDVVWTAEFAAKGWLHPLKDSFALDTAPLLPATVKTATYNNTLYAAPVTSDGGMLYYRTDLVPTPPKTWDEMMGMCSIAKENNMDCYAGQFFKYEGLTVNTAEAINTDGGDRGRGRQDARSTAPRLRPAWAGWPTPTRTATSPSRRSPTPRRRAASRSRRASCCSCASGPTCSTWPRPRAAPR